jgi:hypothetical protein
MFDQERFATLFCKLNQTILALRVAFYAYNINKRFALGGASACKLKVLKVVKSSMSV